MTKSGKLWDIGRGWLQTVAAGDGRESSGVKSGKVEQKALVAYLKVSRVKHL